MNERLQLALIVGCGFVIGLEAPNATRLVRESCHGPLAAHGAGTPTSAVEALAALRAEEQLLASAIASNELQR